MDIINHQNTAPSKVPFAVTEAYKSIRTNLLFLLRKEFGNVLAVTSANVGEGKTTTALNLAIAFSQLGKKVLLIDADLRRPTVYQKAKIPNDAGLSNVIAGFDSFETAVNHVREDLDILTAGKVSPYSSELLGSETFKELLDKLKGEYNYIIIDTPPINVVSDGLVVSALTDGLLFVVREKFTVKDEIAKAISAAEFANIKVLGAILNGTNGKHSSRYGKYGYSKYQNTGEY